MVDPVFADDEHLYRRFPPASFTNGELDVDAVRLPDISVMREKYTLSLDWVLIDTRGERDFSDWGIAKFTVGRIPPLQWYRGVQVFSFAPRHVPYPDTNYPHSEVWAFEGDDPENDDAHLEENTLPPEADLAFREKLLWVIVIQRAPSVAE